MQKLSLLLLFVITAVSVNAQQLLFAAKEKGKKYGYIDAQGNYVIQPQFDFANAFSEGYAVVKAGNKFGVID